MIGHARRVCVTVYATEDSGIGDDVFVRVFHEWIQQRSMGVVLIDVADYGHVPESPGIVLVADEAAMALDRSGGRLGLLVQQRRPAEGTTHTAIAAAISLALDAVGRLERDPRLAGRLTFDTSSLRIEANDRLRAPNTDAAYEAFAPAAGEAIRTLFGDARARLTRVANDPRDRLAVDVSGLDVQRPLTTGSTSREGCAAV